MIAIKFANNLCLLNLNIKTNLNKKNQKPKKKPL